MDMLRQVRKALDDIQQSLNDCHDQKVRLQVHYLRVMINAQPSRQKPWSDYQPMIDEEFS